ncbi:MAG TPA: DMT family transporter [Candidatus Deferrimicrobiaceae bacterium]
MTAPPRTGRLYGKLVLTTFFWGGTFVAGKWAVSEAPPFLVATIRFAVASAVLFALVAWRRARGADGFHRPRGTAEWTGLLSLGLTGVFLYNFFFLAGLARTSATNGSLIVAFNPILTAVLSAMWLKERVLPIQTAGLLLALLGVGVVITGGSPAAVRALSFNPGDLLLLGAPLAWAFYTIAGKKVLARFPPLVATAYACLFGTLLLLPAAALEGPLPAGVSRLTGYGWLSVLQLALLGTVAGFVWWYEGVEALGPARAAVFVNLVPLFGVLLAAGILGERMAGPQLAGGLLVVAGVYAGSRGGREGGIITERSR